MLLPIATILLLTMQRMACNPLPSVAKQLLPADHIDAARMEHDSHLNRDFLREILFGESHDAVAPKSAAEARKLMEQLFHRIDINSDNRLSVDELAGRIGASAAEHAAAAAADSHRAFAAVDANSDGRVSQREFTQRLAAALRGNSSEATRRFADDRSALRLSDAEARHFANAERRWAFADVDADAELSVAEFSCFHHPELCNDTRSSRVADLLEVVDRDGDGRVTRSEFAASPESPDVEAPPGDVVAPLGDDELRRRRLREFDELIDGDGDGVASASELVDYLRPGGRRMSRREARRLLRDADADGDGFVARDEMISQLPLFAMSAVVDAAHAVHHEL